ncbi:MAG: hypothetical protein ABFS17_09035 [Chloroflexota bacterium]
MSVDQHQSPQNEQRSGIGTLNEHSLHADLIRHLIKKGDLVEADVEGYVADILRGDAIIEVQTRQLASLKKKIAAFSENYQVEIIHPITEIKWIVRKNAEGEIVSRRKSPKRGRVEDVFTELVRAWNLIDSPNVKLTIVFIEAEEVWLDDGKGSWRRKYWSISERNLLKIHQQVSFQEPRDFIQLLPPTLEQPFTNKQLSNQLGIRTNLAGKITYTLRKMDVLKFVSKTGNQYQFVINKDY